MQAKVTRRTGFFGMAMKLIVMADGKEMAKLPLDASHTITAEQNSIEISAKQWMTGSNTVEARDGDHVIIQSNYWAMLPLLVSIILIFISNVWFGYGTVKIILLISALIGIALSIIMSFKAGFKVKKKDAPR